MIAALNMDLEPVRLVLANPVNRIQVCADRRRDAGVLYTVVSVQEPQARRTAASLAAEGAFAANGDYLGSTVQGDGLHLVLRYRPERLLASREDAFGDDFPRRRAAAESYLAALAEAQLPPALAMLLLNGRCVNVDAAGSVYFNYYLDFADYRPGQSAADLCRTAAGYVFDLLCRPWALSTGGQLHRYPRELVAFFRKVQVGGFASLGAILAAVRALPNHPQPPHTGLRLVWDRILAGWAFLRRHSTAIFLAVLVAVTIGYAVWQISMRISAQNAAQANTTYGGMQMIGEVSLADENE